VTDPRAARVWVVAAMLAAVAILVVVLVVVLPDRRPTGTAACEGVALTPSDVLADALARHPEGTTFCLAPGTYRPDSTLEPKAGQRLVAAGSPPAVISGARVVEARPEEGRWTIAGQTTLGRSEFDHDQQCRPVDGRDPAGMCVYRDQVFLGGETLWQVASPAELTQGAFFWDYGTGTIHLADDPSGRTLEVSAVAGPAIGGGNPSVVLDGLVVEKFGNAAQSGAIQAARDWTIVGVEVRLNHGAGVHMGPGTDLLDSSIHHNGQLGIHGGQAPCSGATGLVVEGNEIAFNNVAGYNWGWEGGASKWNHTDGLVVRDNYVHDNYGIGLWTDGANINTLYEGNRVEDNAGMGINHELSYAATIRDNVVRGNGFDHPVQGAAWGAGIFVDQSRDVEVSGNVVEGNAAGITAVQEPASDLCGYGVAEIANLYVHDNTVVQTGGIAAGLQLVGTGDTAYFRSKGNRWQGNVYRAEGGEEPRFHWMQGAIDQVAWRAAGQDTETSAENGTGSS
jgi:parallel beta-helix repeat protein